LSDGHKPTVLVVVGSRREVADLLAANPADRYRLHLAMSGLEAVDFLNNNPVDVVVAEEGLDDRPGREVLAWLRDRQPAAGRILLVDSAQYPNAVTLLK